MLHHAEGLYAHGALEIGQPRVCFELISTDRLIGDDTRMSDSRSGSAGVPFEGRSAIFACPTSG